MKRKIKSNPPYLHAEIKSFGDKTIYSTIIYQEPDKGVCPRGAVAKAMDCGIVVSEFELKSRLLRSLSDNYPWERYEPSLSSQLWVK